MQTEMPKKYWRNLPEASLIKPLIANAERATRAMIESDATEPHKPQKREDAEMPRKRAASVDSLDQLARGSRRLPRLPALEGRDANRVRRRACPTPG